MALQVATTEKPTFFNKDMVLGGLIGLFTLQTALPVLGITLAAAAIPLAAAAVGAVVGGLIGRARMSHDLAQGKTVRSPSMLNEKTAIGGLMGVIGGAYAGKLLAVGMATAFPLAAIHIGLTTVGAILIGKAVGLAVGAYMGGKSGKAEMERDYALAQSAPIVQLSRSPADVVLIPSQTVAVPGMQQPNTTVVMPDQAPAPNTTIVMPDAQPAPAPQMSPTFNNTTVIHHSDTPSAAAPSQNVTTVLASEPPAASAPIMTTVVANELPASDATTDLPSSAVGKYTAAEQAKRDTQAQAAAAGAGRA